MPNSDPRVGYRDLTELSDLYVSGVLTVLGSSNNEGKLAFETTDDTDTAGSLIHGIGYPTTDARFLQIYSPRSSTQAVGQIILYSGVAGLAPTNTVEVAGHLIPKTNSLYNLGGSTRRWQWAYIESLYVGASTRSIGTISTYDPVLQVLTGTTQPDVGTGANAREDGLYSQVGPLIQAHVTITWSSDGAAGNGIYVICPPKSIHSDLIVGGSVGGGRIIDASGNDTWIIDCRKAGSTKVNLRFTGTTGSNVTNSSPFTCGSSDDQFDLHLNYLTTEA